MIAGERREVVSIYPELRLLTWAGVMLISSGVGLYIAKHLDDVGPLAIASIIGIAAIACYAWSWWKRGREASLASSRSKRRSPCTGSGSGHRRSGSLQDWRW